MFRKEDFKRLLISDVVIRRDISEVDNLGGREEDLKIVDKVKGRISTTGSTPSDKMHTDKDQAEIRFKAFLPLNTNIKRTDKLFADGNAFYVMDVREPSLMGHHLEAFLRQIQPKVIVAIDSFLQEESNILGFLEIVPDGMIGLSMNFSVNQGTLYIDLSLVGVDENNSDIEGFIEVVKNVSGNILENSLMESVLSVNFNISILEENFSSIDGLLTRIISNEGNMNNDSSIQMLLKVDKNISSDIENNSEINGFIIRNINVDSSINNQSILSSILNINRDMVADSSNESEIFGLLEEELLILLNGSLSSFTNLTSELKAIMPVISDIENISDLETEILLDKFIVSTIINESDKEGNLERLRGLLVESENVSLISSEMVVNLSILADVLNESDISVDMVLLRDYIANMDNDSFLRADLFVDEVDLMVGEMENISDLSSLLGVLLEIESTSFNDSSIENINLLLDKNLATTLFNVSEKTGAVTINKEILATVFNTSFLELLLLVTKNVESLVLNISDKSAFLNIEKDISSNIFSSSSLNVIVSLDKNLITNVFNESDLDSLLSTIYSLKTEEENQSLEEGNLILDKPLAVQLLNNSDIDSNLLKNIIMECLVNNQVDSNGNLLLDKFIVSNVLNQSQLNILLGKIIAINTLSENEIFLTGDVILTRNVNTNVENLTDLSGDLIILADVITGFTDFTEYPLNANPDEWTLIWNHTDLNWSIETDVGSGLYANNQVLEVNFNDGVTGRDALNKWDEIPFSTENIKIHMVGAVIEVSSEFDGLRLIARASGDTGEENYYSLRFTGGLGGRIRIEKYSNGSLTPLSSYFYDGITSDLGVYHHFVFEVNKNTIRAKAWQVGESEPEDWQVTADDFEFIEGYAGLGVRKDFTSGNNDLFRYDSFEYEISPIVGLYHTNFGEYSVGTIPSDWTQRWDTANADYEVFDFSADSFSGNTLRYISSDTGFHHCSWDELDGIDNIEVYIRVRTSTTSVTPLGILTRASFPSNQKNGYLLDLNNDNRFRIVKWVDDTLSIITEETFDFSADTWYWLKFRVEDDNLSGKVWEDGETEPEDWMLTAVDEDVPSGNWNGVFAFNGGIDTDYDLYQAENLDVEPPPPPPPPEGVFFTDFSEYTTNQAPDDWTNLWHGDVTWTVIEESGVEGGKLLNGDFVSENRHRFLRWDIVPESSDQEVLQKVRVVNTQSEDTSLGENCFAVVRAGGEGEASEPDWEGYATWLQLYNGFFSFDIIRIEGDSQTSIANTSFEWTGDTWYYVRLRAEGSTISAKIWEEGETEPVEWTLETTDTTYTSGYAGIGNHTGLLADSRQWDIVGIGIDGASAPIEPIN